MRKELSPVTSVLLLLMFGAMLWTIFSLRSAAVGVPTLTHMHTSPYGGLYIMLGTDLFEHDGAGRPIRRIDLKELGVKDVIGDFAFFSNGDLLLRIGADERSLSDKIRQFFRRDNLEPTGLETARGGLFRCDLTAMACVPFGDTNYNLNQSFFLTVDWETDQVLVADSSRHRLLLISSTGDQMAQTKQGLKFPNQVIYRDGLAYVANANRHEIAVFKVEDAGFKRTVQGFLAAEVGTSLRGNIWTSGVMEVEEQFWVVNSDKNMANGIVVRFSKDGERLGELELPETADVFSVLPFRDDVLVNDLNAGRIYRFSSAGERLPDFESSLLDERVQELAQSKESYYRWMYLVLGLFGIVFVVGVVIGLRQEMALDQHIPLDDPEALALTPETPGILWIDPNPKFIRKMKMLMWAFAALCLLLIPLIWVLIGVELPLGFFLAIGIMPATWVVVLYVVSRFTRQRLGILGNRVIAVDGSGRFSAARSEYIRYSPNHILVGNVVITLRTNQPLFPEEQIVAHLYPLLKSAQYLTQWQMYGVIMRLKPIQSAFAVVGILLLVLAIVWMESGVA